MKPYLMVLAAFVFIASFAWVPDVYAQFGGGMGGGMGGRHGGGAERAKGCDDPDKAVDAARNLLAALEDIESAGKDLYQTLQPDQKSLADLRMTGFLAPLLRG